MKIVIDKVILVLLFFITSAFADYKLTLNMNSMAPHVGQMFQVRVVDLDNDLEVGRKTLHEIPSSEFTVELWVLLNSHDYQVDFYADMNNNKTFDGQPTDHAWSMMIENVQSNVVLDFTHNLNFSDIQFPEIVPLLDLVDDWEGIWDNPTYDVSGSATASVEMKNNDQTAILTLTAWGIFGDPNPVSYMLTGTVNSLGDTATFTASDPWQGSVIISNGEITGTITYESMGISAEVMGNYGRDQFIVYYHMTGAFDAKEIGVLQRDVEVNTLVRNNSRIADDFILYDNYPNPFNPSTVISYSIPEQSDVSLNIYNQLGQLVNSVSFDNQQAGNYSWAWYGDDYKGSLQPSGIYFFQLIANSNTGQVYQQLKKMTLIK